MWNLLAVADPQTTLASGNILAILALIIVTLAGVVVYLGRKIDKQASDSAIEIKALNKLIYDDNKAHAADYRELAQADTKVLSDNAQNLRILSEKIEVAKGYRR
jgi:hypothetical protein